MQVSAVFRHLLLEQLQQSVEGYLAEQRLRLLCGEGGGRGGGRGEGGGREGGGEGGGVLSRHSDSEEPAYIETTVKRCIL